MNAKTLIEQLSVIKNPRRPWKIDHSLADILLLTICAVIAGAEGRKEIDDFGLEGLDWLRDYGGETWNSSP